MQGFFAALRMTSMKELRMTSMKEQGEEGELA